VTTADALPSDPDALRTLQLAERERHAAELRRRDAEAEALRAEAVAAAARAERLEQLIAELRRHRFGRRSERLDPDQMSLALEDLEQALGEAEAIAEATPRSGGGARRRRANRGHLPADLPREETVVEPAGTTCACCGGAMHRIGEACPGPRSGDVSERLDVVPARLRVLVTRRPKYACRRCAEGVAQAPAPPRLIEGGLPTEALLAHVVVSKYADHLPLYRQAQILARQGVALDRSTLADWVGRTAWYLRPLHGRLLDALKASARLFADETPAPVLDPGRGRTKTGQLWAGACPRVGHRPDPGARDDRPWGGTDPPAVAYVYAPDRRGERPAAHLAGFSGVLQVDGYAGYGALAEGGRVRLAYCWSHVRRRFYEIAAAGDAPAATEALQRIRGLYLIEAEIRGRTAEERRAARRERAAPIVEAMRPWLQARLAAASRKSRLAEAIGYALERWDGLTLYLDDGRVEIDSNTVERRIRPLALGRKNALFAGSDEGGVHWAVLASLVETCKLNGVAPQAWFAAVLGRIAAGHPANRLDELMPWRFRDPDPAVA